MKLILPVGAKHKGAEQQLYSDNQKMISKLKTMERIEKLKMKNKSKAALHGVDQCQK